MAHIVEVNNPFESVRDTCVYEVTGGRTIFQILRERHGSGFTGFKYPTICIVDGNAVPQDQWEKFIISEDGIVNFVRQQGFVAAIYYVYVLLVVAAIALALTMPKPQIPGSPPEPDTVYDLTGQRNQTKLGAVIECPYGKNRLWPSYAAKSYNEYFNNEQYQYQLFCLGQGVYDIHAIQIEDTPIANFQDVTYEIYEPGDSVDLFPDNVVTSSEVGGIELFGANETDYAGITGPFILNGPGTLSNKLEVDLSYPNGLFLAGDDGKLQGAAIETLVEYQEIDDSGTPVGAWTEFFQLNKTMSTNTPQRFTLLKEVTPGRYQVRAHRTNDKILNTKVTAVVRWDAARAFLPSTKVYGDVTLLAIRARATNNLNNSSSNRINVIATRKLPIWNGTSWSAPTATRSLVWAFCDVFRNQVYGGKVDDQYLDLPEMLALDTIFTASSTWFDYIFDQSGGVWDAATIVARVGRAIPMLNGSLITMVRDFPKTVPTAVFNQENIVQGSFKWDIKLAGPIDYDGVEIEFVDPVSFLPETVLCLVDGEEGNNPEQIKFPGCTNRNRAWREGMYMRETTLKVRENISFSTGLEGRIPTYGDLIKVVHDIPRWGQGGLVLAVAEDNKTLTLNEPTDFSAGGTHKVALRKKNGDVFGPAVVTAGVDKFHIVLVDALTESDFFFDDINEKPLFLFGPDSGNSGVLCTVIGLSPNNDDTVDVKCAVYTAAVFANDGDNPDDPVPNGSVPNTPILGSLTMSCANVSSAPDPINPGKGTLSWIPVAGAQGYKIQRSADNATFVDEAFTDSTFHTFNQTVGEQLYFRIAPVASGGGLGAWCYPPPPPGGVVPPSSADAGDYFDFFHVVSPTVEFSCRTRGDGAGLCGLVEYDDVSDPPRKYRTQNISGAFKDCAFSGGGCPDTSLANGARYLWSGSYKYDKDDCTTTNSQTESAYNCPVCSTDGTFAYDVTLTSADLTTYLKSRADVVTSKTSLVMSGHGTCEACGGFICVANGSLRGDLTDEDKEEDAIARSIEATPWSDWGDPTIGCFSTWGVRGTGEFTFDYKEAQYKAEGSGLNDSDLAVMRVTIRRTNLISMVDEIAEIQDFTTYADGFGGFSFTIDIPVVRGYMYYVGEVGFFKLGE